MQVRPSIIIKKCRDREFNNLKGANKQVLRYQEGEMAHTHTHTRTHTHTHTHTYIYIYPQNVIKRVFISHTKRLPAA